ncbi:hypothetical protein [Nocardia sp. NPDC057455]|uniref:hypothetical protein n=1 Tax=Nocardia sp. NPDC057455 TaxID=3346138 RepID=UPI003672A667
MIDPSARRAGCGLLTLWPAGLVLVLAHAEMPSVTTPVFVVLDVIYVLCAVVLVQRLAPTAEPAATTFVLAGIGLFAVCGFTGGPTARDPEAMMVNTAVLLVTSVALLTGAVGFLLQHRRSASIGTAVQAVVLFAIGTCGFCLNLIARFAIVLTGADRQQLAVEDTHWMASRYLRGLDGPVDFVGYTLVWLDLVQLAYIVTAYLAAAALSRLATAEAGVLRRTGVVLTRTGYGLAAALSAGAVLAVVMPRSVDEFPAIVAFVISIPFMATLVPFALGVAVLTTAGHRARQTQELK